MVKKEYVLKNWDREKYIQSMAPLSNIHILEAKAKEEIRVMPFNAVVKGDELKLIKVTWLMEWGRLDESWGNEVVRAENSCCWSKAMSSRHCWGVKPY